MLREILFAKACSIFELLIRDCTSGNLVSFVDIAELERLLFEELELPRLEKKDKRAMNENEILFNDVRKKGIASNIDKRRTILENLRRNARDDHASIGGISPDDIRYRTWNEVGIRLMRTTSIRSIFPTATI